MMVVGSPPRVRGKRQRRREEVMQGGITPACAGKTTTRQLGITSSRDHPRVCGENITDCEYLWKDVGSPPRVRGKLMVNMNIV